MRGPVTSSAIIITLCAMVLVGAGRAQAPATINPAALLRGPERHDFSWEVRATEPQLTLQQRYHVRVSVSINPRDIKHGGREHDLHFLLKVAEPQGAWLPGEDRTHIAIPPKLERDTDVHYNCDVYLKPGKYELVIAAYDSVSQQADVRRMPVRVANVRHDPLPELERGLPAVEFGTNAPYLDGDAPPDEDPVNAGQQWKRAPRQLSLPVHNAVPTRLDIVLNVSSSMNPGGDGTGSNRRYRRRLLRMMQVGDILSQMQLAHGCVRVSAVDINDQRVLYEGINVGDFHWVQEQRTLVKRNQDVVDILALQKRKEAANFFRGFLAGLLKKPSGCTPEGVRARRLVVILGGRYQFAGGTGGAWPAMPANAQFVYWRLDSVPFGDDIDHMLNALDVRRDRFTTGEKFRRALAQLIAELEKKV